MENSCRRCHSTIEEAHSFCPTCGLPQLVYADDAAPESEEQDRWTGAVRDAGMIAWRSAIKSSLIFAVPAGLLASSFSPLRGMNLLLAAMASAWAVILYARLERPAWMTRGAGARIGLVTGLMTGWLAFAVSGGALFVERYALHQGANIDQEWQNRVALSQQMNQQWMGSVLQVDEDQAKSTRDQVQSFMLSPEGHAGIEAFGYAFNTLFLLCFAAGGGAVGARWGARRRASEL